MRLGLVVLPVGDAARACVDLAARLVEGRSARAVLGAAALPHVTLLHVESDADPAALWADAQRLPRALRFEPIALGFLRYETPYNAPPAPLATMAWLIGACTPAMRAAEEAALALPFVRRSKVTTSQGDRFQPHVTLAIWDGASPSSPTLPAFEAFDAPLALGVIAANGVYERTLFTA